MKSEIKVIPKVNSIKLFTDKFYLSANDALQYQDKSMAGEFLCSLTGLKKDENGRIKLTIDKTIKGDEAYKLTIKKDAILICASTDAGLFYGVQTLRQILPVDIEAGKVCEDIVLPCVEILDEPRYAYRGFMFDSVRHFFGVDVIKSLLDLMALHKLNRFHWHLSDDQGFRVEIDKYPRLMRVASKRKESQIRGMELPWTRRYDGTPHEGYYTKQQIREVVEYAKKRHIQVIPEIDFPGHFVAALAAYPEFSCTGNQMEVWTRWGISKDVLCVGKQKSLEFAKDILGEVVELFSYKHIHIGGDEAPTSRWKNCPDCQKLKREKGLKNEHQLQTYFMNELAEFLKQKNCTVIGWDEILKGNPDKDIVVQSWSPNGHKQVLESIKKGRKCIVSNYFNYYLDHAYCIAPLNETYDFDPMFKGLTEDESKNILGVEAPLWSEVVDSVERIHWQMFPRLTAISESAWTQLINKDYDDFLDRLTSMEHRYGALGVTSAGKQCYSYKGKRKLLKLFFGSLHPAVVEYKKR